jgi:FkbM family methyltransferase
MGWKLDDVQRLSTLANMITFVDIGARGGITQKWRLIKDQLDVHAFEPNKDEWDNLHKQIYWEGATIYPDALWSEKKVVRLHVTRNPGLTSVYKPLPLSDRLDVLRVDRIEANTLDSYNLDPDFIKIDTQGSELDILMGAKKSLKSTLCVQIEVEFEELYDGQPLFNDVNLFMLGQGFYLWKMGEIKLVEGIVPFTDAIYFKAGSEDDEKRKIIEQVYLDNPL